MVLQEIVLEAAEQPTPEFTDIVSDRIYPIASSPTSNLEQLAGEIWSELDAIERLDRHKIEKKIDIGKKLLEAKSQLKHGTFRAWLESQFGQHDWRPRKCMQLAKTFDIEDFINLDIEIVPSALEILAAPSLGKPAFEQAVEIARATAEAGKKPRLTSNIAKQIARQRSQGSSKRQQKSKTQTSTVNLALGFGLEGQPKVGMFSNLSTSTTENFPILGTGAAFLNNRQPKVINCNTSAVSINAAYSTVADFTNLDIATTPLNQAPSKVEDFTSLDTSAAWLDDTQPKIENFTNLDTTAIPSTDFVVEDSLALIPSTALLANNNLKPQTTIDVPFERVEKASDRLSEKEPALKQASDFYRDENELKSQIKLANELKYLHSNSYVVPTLQDSFQVNWQKSIARNFISLRTTLDSLLHLTELELTSLFEAFIEKMGVESIIKLVMRQIDEHKIDRLRDRSLQNLQFYTDGYSSGA